MNRTVAVAVTITSMAALGGCAAVQAAPVAASIPAATQAQANAHARAVMARCVREHPPASLAALQAQVKCAVPAAYRTAAGQCITLAAAGARDAFTTRRRITQVFAEQCMASNRF